MSDEWKIAQGLKREAQNSSFGTNNTAASIANDYIVKTQKQREYQAMIDYWSKGKSIYYKPQNKEDLIGSFKMYIDYCKSNNINLQGKYNHFHYTIESEEPLRISFNNSSNNNAVISDSKMNSYIKFGIEDKFISVRNNDSINDFFINRTIEVTDGNNVVECYDFKSTGDKNLDKKIKDYLVSINSDFEISKKDNKIRKPIISKEEKLEPFINIDGSIDDNITIHEDKYGRKEKNDETYKHYIERAQEYEKKCKEIYSLFSDAYETMNIQEKTTSEDEIKEEKETNIDNFPNEEDIQPVKNQAKETINVDALSNEDLDKFIEDMDAKQKEKQQQIERLKKIKKAKELIELSKAQDEEIAELESQLQMEGKEIDE